MSEFLKITNDKLACCKLGAKLEEWLEEHHKSLLKTDDSPTFETLSINTTKAKDVTDIDLIIRTTKQFLEGKSTVIADLKSNFTPYFLINKKTNQLVEAVYNRDHSLVEKSIDGDVTLLPLMFEKLGLPFPSKQRIPYIDPGKVVALNAKDLYRYKSLRMAILFIVNWRSLEGFGQKVEPTNAIFGASVSDILKAICEVPRIWVYGNRKFKIPSEDEIKKMSVNELSKRLRDSDGNAGLSYYFDMNKMTNLGTIEVPPHIW